MSDDILVEVAEYERSNILERLKENWPRNFLLHQYITILEDYKKGKSCFSQVLYRFGNFDDGIYLIETKFPTQTESLTLFFICTASSDLTSLQKVLLQTSRIPWHSNKYIFEVVLSRFTPIIGKVFVTKGLQVVVQHYSLLWLPHDTKVDVERLSDDVYLDVLDERHVSEVAKNWPSFPCYETFLAMEISTNHGLGLFRKSDKRMLSSALTFHSGGIFMLFSDPQYRRKGYGETVIRHMVTKIRHLGRIPFCTVFSDNIPSQKLVRKVGFTDFDKADYIFPPQFLKRI